VAETYVNIPQSIQVVDLQNSPSCRMCFWRCVYASILSGLWVVEIVAFYNMF
jgi:hypothetical protein